MGELTSWWIILHYDPSIGSRQSADLPQVLDDGTNTYTYGLGRISQTNNSTTEYFLGDALGSVRQLTNSAGDVTLAKSYNPYGEVLASNGSGASVYAYTGEMGDVSGLTYLRSRYYSPADGRFQSRDTWGGEAKRPMSMNRWGYASGNPIRFIDPTGHYNRESAVSFARSHDLMDTFNEGRNFRNKSGWTDCAAFASSVISRGGVEDTRDVPPSALEDRFDTGVFVLWYADYSPNSYWKREWAETFWDDTDDETKHFGIGYYSWMHTQSLYNFLTQEKQFESFQISASNLEADLKNHKEQIKNGDLVFYGSTGDYSHVAVIVSPSAPQTFFGGFSPHEKAYFPTTTWTDYLVFGGAAENKQAFAKEALDISRLFRCDANDSPWLPRVVERSGAILYHGSRSINNTFEPQGSYTIVHIK